MKNTFLLLLSLAVLFSCQEASDNPPAPDTTAPEITIAAPLNQYYTALPSAVEYSLSEECPTITIELNGTALAEGADLSSSINGLNTLTISVADSAENTNTESVTFFYNGLTINFADDFERLDSDTIGGEWDNEYDAQGLLSIANGSISANGTSDANNYGTIDKGYEGSVNTEIIQSIEIQSLSQEFESQIMLVLWDYQADELNQIQAYVKTIQEGGNYSGYRLDISDFNLVYASGATASNNLFSSDIFSFDFTSGTLTLAFYRNNNDFQAVIYDANNGIITSGIVDDWTYNSLTAASFNQRGLQIMPCDNSGSGEIRAIVDNYNFFQ